AQDLRDIQDIVETIELLKERRDMTVQEIRLVLMIEDPRESERRRQMGIENESGCSRDEIADAFREVCEDRVPADRMALRKLAQDMRDWPRLREEPGVEEEAEGSGGQRKSHPAIMCESQAHDSRNRVPPGMRWFFQNCAVSRLCLVATIFHCASQEWQHETRSVCCYP
ncbi:unnamed protein product, partial [Closterium sp. Yama58-4]